MKKALLFLVFLLPVFFISFYYSANAQSGTSTTTSSSSPATPSEPVGQVENLSSDVVSCFDYYKFGSVQAPVTPEVSKAISGTTIHFTGFVKNENAYPVVGGTVFVKIFKKQKDWNANGPDVVDQFVAKNNINIDGNATQKLDFAWKIPANAKSGEYQVVTFFTSENKFNLLGLSFTDDVIGNRADFSVSGEQDSIVKFDKNSVKVNDSTYIFGAFPPTVETSKDGVVSADLVNETDKKQTVVISWKTYWWDAQKEQNLLDTKTETVVLDKKQKKTLSYTVKDKTHSVYLIMAEAKYLDTKSILGVRFTRNGIDIPRINFPAVTSFPLTKDSPTTLFSCLHNTNDNNLKDVSLSLKLEDKSGKVFHEYKYSGVVTGTMMGVREIFTPKKSYDNFSIVAELSRGGKVVDSATMKYDCKEIDPSKCLPSSGMSNLLINIMSIIFLVLIVLFYTAIKRKNKKTVMAVGILLVLLAVASYFVLTNKQVFGQDTILTSHGEGSVTTSFSITKYLWGKRPDKNEWTQIFVPGTTATVTYRVSVTDPSTGNAIISGSTLSPGKVLRFKFLPNEQQDIFWHGTGSAWDSPYGNWVANASYSSSLACVDADKFAQHTITGAPIQPNKILGYNYFYANLNVAPAVKTLTNTSGLSCGALSSDGSIDCTVQSTTNPLIINPIFSIAPTIGKFYTSTYGTDTKKCGGTDIPLIESNTAAAYCPNTTDWLTLQMAGCDADQAGETRTRSSVPNSSTLVLNVPAQTIGYQFTVMPPAPTNNPPTPPTISGPETGVISASLAYSVVSTDPDGDQIKYNFDWNADGSTDAYSPTSDYVNSGTSQSESKTWATIGTKTFKVQAEDNKGATSTWSTYTVGITNAPVTGACGIANGTIVDSISSASATDLCSVGTPGNTGEDSVQFTWSCMADIASPQCSAHKTTVQSAPLCGTTENVCAVGIPTDTTDDANYLKWDCTNNNTTISCSIPKTVDTSPVCGLVKNTCSLGDPSNFVEETIQYLWDCTLGNSVSSCFFPKNPTTPPSCGTTLNTCTDGTFSDVEDTDSYTKWSCVKGEGDFQQVASCQIPLSAEPACGATKDTCTLGDFQDRDDTKTDYLWSCTNQVTAKLCSLGKPALQAPVCGSSEGSCSIGSPSNVSNDGLAKTWSCSENNLITNCVIPVNGCNDNAHIAGAIEVTGEICRRWTCTANIWSDQQVPCSRDVDDGGGNGGTTSNPDIPGGPVYPNPTPAGTFKINPQDAPNCKAKMNAINLKSCYLAKGNTSVGSWLVSYLGNVSIPLVNYGSGTYKFVCQNATGQTIFVFNDRCISNPNIIEK